MIDGIKGIYFDFGNVIGYPKQDIDRKNLYLNWDGIRSIMENPDISKHLNKGKGLKEVEEFFINKIYNAFIEHEKTDLIDPKSYNLLTNELPSLFSCRINEQFVDNILECVNTMKYLEIYPDVSSILDKLKNKGYIISMISNMMLPGKLLIHKLSENDILYYFSTITISSDIGFIKPHKEIFLRTLEKDFLKPAEVIFVGDSYSQDVLGAKGTGMKTVWLNLRHESVNNNDSADFIIERLEELNEML